MYLSRIHLDPRCREARRDLADPYQLHATLCRAFSEPDRKCPQSEFLWRLEPEMAAARYPCLLVQSQHIPEWSQIGIAGWLHRADPPLELYTRLRLEHLCSGRRFRFRLRANPSVCRNGKRRGLLKTAEQAGWLQRQGQRLGFRLPQTAPASNPHTGAGDIDVQITQEQMLRGKQHQGNAIQVYSVLFDGCLSVTEPALFKPALRNGVGHGKFMGLGLLSVAPTA